MYINIRALCPNWGINWFHNIVHFCIQQGKSLYIYKKKKTILFVKKQILNWILLLCVHIGLPSCDSCRSGWWSTAALFALLPVLSLKSDVWNSVKPNEKPKIGRRAFPSTLEHPEEWASATKQKLSACSPPIRSFITLRQPVQQDVTAVDAANVMQDTTQFVPMPVSSPASECDPGGRRASTSSTPVAVPSLQAEACAH